MELSPIKYRRALLVGAEAVGLTEGDLLKRSQRQDIVAARFGVWAALRDAGYIVSAIGRAAGRDPTTVTNGIQRVESSAAHYTAYRARDAVALDISRRADIPRIPKDRPKIKMPAPAHSLPSPVKGGAPLPTNRRERVLEEMRRQQKRRARIQEESDRRGIW